MPFLKYILASVTATYFSLAVWHFSAYEWLSVLLFVNYFLYFIDVIGKKIIILEIACIMAILTWLIAPLGFYHYFNETHHLAKLWKLFMPVDSNVYYGYVFWGTLAMIVGMSINLKNKNILHDPGPYFERIKGQLSTKPHIGYILIFLGIISNIMSLYIQVPALGFVFYLLNKLYLVGLLYLYFTVKNFNGLFLFSGIIILLLLSVKKALFGEFIYYSMLTVFLAFSQTKMRFSSKLALIIGGVAILFLIQSVKQEYRKTAWKEGADLALFSQLVIDNTKQVFQLLQNEAVTFAIMARLNQGYLIASTMYTVPQKKPYAYGNTIFLSAAAILIPRFIWPSKPQSGGKFNLERFANLKIKGYSMNISPIGEAYGNFSRWGGIIFMFFYGLFFNLFLNYLLKKSILRPLMILWLPFLYLFAIGTETDILSTVNYLVKASIFLFVIYQFFRLFFRVRLI